MPIITDLDLLIDGVDVVLDTAAKTISLLTTSAIENAGATGGVTGQALYSWLKERWKNSTTYIKYPFPMEAITPEQFEFINGWKPLNDSTRKLIRTAGWTERNISGNVLRRYAGIVSLGTLGETDQPYYRFGTGAAVNFTYQGPVNEGIQIYGDIDNGNIDYTGGTALSLFCREQGKTYAASNNTAIGAPTLSYIVYRFPLSNSVDLKISASDAMISTVSPYTDITIEYFSVNQDYDVDGDTVMEPYRFIITDASNTASTQQIYEKIQYQLRQAVDIDSGAGNVIGKTADALLHFVGDTLIGANGVRIAGLNAGFLNSVEFYDYNGIKRIYPYVASGTINFGPNAGVGDFLFKMFFTDTPSGDYGTANAIIVNDKDGSPISGTYNGSPVAFSFAYDSNTQGGRTPATNAPVKVVGIGLTGGQFISVDHTITRTQGQSILISPAQERNYVNVA